MIGKRISGRYEILETIGGGGMADVYKAMDVILDRQVAVKVLQAQFSKDEQFIKRFRREAQAATSLAHQNVVSIYDVGEEENLYYIVMEYVEGPTLKELIQQRGPLPVDETIDIMSQMMAAISHAHMNQIVHRDIKPHNILIGEDGVVKVTDFGIARAMSSATITHTNSVMGSVHYLSPEQARGGLVTFKSDIYSLGIVLFEMVTGQLPFSGDTAVSIALKHLQNDIPSPKEIQPSLPQSIENVIVKATAKDPFYRYGTVSEMDEDLSTALDPARVNERPYDQKEDDEEATKAIPIIKDEQLEQEDFEKTMEAPPIKKVEEPKAPAAEEEVKKPKKKRRKWLWAVLIVLFLLIGTGVTALALMPSWFQVDDVDVPDVRESSFEEAEAELRSLGLEVEREDVEDDAPAEEVVSQHPRPGSVVKQGSTVRLFVSTGPEEGQMIDVTGRTIEEAQRLLNDFADVRLEERETNDVSPGIVIEQTPEAGESVVPEETTVTLIYSATSDIVLENMQGMTENEAHGYLQENGLRTRFSYDYSSSVAEGRVISHSPASGATVSEGDDVTIVVSRGPEPQTDQGGGQQEQPQQPQQPQTRSHLVNQPIEASQEVQVRIVYRDATTGGQDRVFIDETISETKTYQIPLEASADQPGSFDLYINGEFVKSSREYTY
ncbi:Stk1 family PASTA domain-containing Ser/Thr kinase [Halalkalibacterium halodurans]|uniref:Serine/threonine-protein kinase PrkC n=1 Tax=Halalkalibacterium halodurans TaxID=86665 RepID=A0A0M0KIM6_ALKHA|nr:Stk1 family PASTA domain-containing Ser/Thr kinase [Halalkalibacterium halodurans]TPE68163.1 Stk1 family PASTA domain-containing Ser/Thr kinase [Halalkalibacterium halodurans]